MTAYVTVQLEITDQEVFGEYRQHAVAALAKHGGRPVKLAGSETLHDAGIGPSPSVLLAFPDAASVRAWIHDPDLAEVHALRNRGARATITLLEPAS
ncbi:MAG: DUF1330 domain-containing protein [Pseudomonadota bacterium]